MHLKALLTIHLIAVSAALAQTPQASDGPPCAVPDIVSDEWRTMAGFGVGVEVLHPPAYRRKIWESVSDTTRRYLELHKTPWISTHIVIESAPKATRAFLAWPDSGRLNCVLRTRSGDFPAVMYRGKLGRCTGCPPPEPSWNVNVLVAHPQTGALFVIRGFAEDSATFAEHVAIASTLRFLRSSASP